METIILFLITLLFNYHFLIRKPVRKRTPELERIARRAYKDLVNKIQFQKGYDYNGEVMPFVAFYKFLAKKNLVSMENKYHQLKLYIPDTVVYGD